MQVSHARDVAVITHESSFHHNREEKKREINVERK